MKSFRPVLLALVLSLPLGATSYLSAAPDTYGTMMVAKGDIKVTSSKSGKTETGKVGFKVYAGDSIASGPDSRAKIIMSDKNVLNLSPDSKMTIEKYENNPAKDSRNVELKVDYGKVRASVNESYDGDKNKFNVRTATAVAGVRGTDFIAGFNPQTRRTQIITFSGVVAVGQPGPAGSIVNPVFVQPGQQTQVNEGGKATPPAAVPKDQMKNMDTDSDSDKAAAGPASGNAPITETPPEKQDDKKQTSKEGNSERAPASSTSPGSMVSAKDMDVSVSKDIRVTETPKIPTVVAPTLPSVAVPVQNPFIDNAIRNQRSKVKVEICLPGTTGC